MQFAFVSSGSDTRTLMNQVQAAEAAGWDAFFIPDCIGIETSDYPPGPAYDPWVQLAALAVVTERIKLGTLLTAPSRRRPWKLARETVTLDHLSNGRLILAVGLGAAQDDVGFYKVGEAMDLRTRAELMDESLALLDGFWRGERVTFRGKHYTVEGMQLLPPSLQQPRIPVWVVASLGRNKSMDRAVRWDGIIPQKQVDGAPAALTAEDVRALHMYVAARRDQSTPFEIITEGETPGDDRATGAELVRPLAEAGLTWWVEARWGASGDALMTRITQGPPRLT